MALQTATTARYANSHIQAEINKQLEEENRMLRQELKVVNAALQRVRYKQKKHMENMSNEINDDEKQPNQHNNNQQKFIWEQIDHSLRTHNIKHIKDLITKTNINLEQTDSRHKNMTLLMKSCIFGNYDIAELLVHSEANLYPLSDEKSCAFDYAEQWANYHIAQLLQFEDLGTALGSEVQKKIDILHKQNGITQCALDNLDSNVLDGIVELMKHCVDKQLPFSDDMMHIAWNYIKTQNKKAINSALFQLLLATYSRIVNDTSNARAWSWLQNYLIPSTIWLNNYAHDNTRTLFNELFIGAEKANDKLSRAVLLSNINRMKKEHSLLWKKLKKFKVNNCENPIGANKVSIVRQDEIENGIKAEYTKKELLGNKPDYTNFNPINHYDLSEYLNKLFFRGSIVDEQFQNAVENIMKEIIKNDNSIKVWYRRGPIKLIKRCIAKIEHKYVNEDFPTAAHLLDINRCSLTFDDLPSMMKGIKMFINIINSKKTCIKRIVRCKNGWNSTDFIDSKPKYSDIKFNVVIDIGNNIGMVGEIQILLSLMERFKIGSHKYYDIFRMQEFIRENYVDIAPFLLDKQSQLFNYACTGDRKSLLNLIVTYNIKPNELLLSHNKSGKSILNKICEFDHIKSLKLIQRLLTKEQFTNALQLYDKTDEEWCPIGEALNANSTNIINFLCENFPKLMINFHDKHKMRGKHSLHFACQNGNITYLKWYLKQIKNETIEEKKRLLQVKDENGYIPLVSACNYSQINIIKYLMEWIHNEKTQNMQLLTIKDNNGCNTPLMLSCFKGNPKVVHTLLSNVDDKLRIQMILDIDKNGFTPLIYSALSHSNRTIQCVEILLSYVTDSNQRLEYILHESNNCYDNKTAYQHSNNEQFKSKMLECIENIQKLLFC